MYPRIQAQTPKICKIPGVLWPVIYGFSNSSVQNRKGKQFFELFGPDWQVFGLILESEMKCLLTFLFFSCRFSKLSLKWKRKTFRYLELGNSSWILFWVIEVSSQNSHLMHLLKESLIKINQIFFKFQLENLKHSNRTFFLFFYRFTSELGKLNLCFCELKLKI
ncbi:hypothetical protein C1645_737055 [Glomus cerebriforme]|uniref:Uncharacterized protein n=1 Tax=Glomus cerebriforme TaxID=658196 RepID=A0A397SZ26_9GLOM|nr:hypothetical protein C1645_737055 [Glomus cerebriforme]